jgi:hypothetical protein
MTSICDQSEEVAALTSLKVLDFAHAMLCEKAGFLTQMSISTTARPSASHQQQIIRQTNLFPILSFIFEQQRCSKAPCLPSRLICLLLVRSAKMLSINRTYFILKTNKG